MKKTATLAGSGQDLQSWHIMPACPPVREGRNRPQKHEVELKPDPDQLLATARCYVQACLAMPELQDLSIVELEQQLVNAKCTFTFLKATYSTLIQASEKEPGLVHGLDSLSIWQRALGNQLQEIEQFFRLELGTPTAAEIVFDFGLADG